MTPPDQRLSLLAGRIAATHPEVAHELRLVAIEVRRLVAVKHITQFNKEHENA